MVLTTSIQINNKKDGHTPGGDALHHLGDQDPGSVPGFAPCCYHHFYIVIIMITIIIIISSSSSSSSSGY